MFQIIDVFPFVDAYFLLHVHRHCVYLSGQQKLCTKKTKQPIVQFGTIGVPCNMTPCIDCYLAKRLLIAKEKQSQLTSRF